MTDICNVELNIGDKVSIKHKKLNRVGIITNITNKMVGVKFDEETHNVKFGPYNLTKITNQEVELTDYHKYHKGGECENMMVDICGTELKIGDKVSAYLDQEYRVGMVLGFTKNKVIIGLDYTCNGFTKISDLDQVKTAPVNVTKIINQSVGLKDYYYNHPIFTNEVKKE